MADPLDRRLLLTDLQVGLLLLNDLRYRTLEKTLGVSRQDANLITLIGIGVLAHTAHDKFERAMTGPGAPTVGEFVLGLATGREVLNKIAGSTFEETPVLADLLVPAMLAAALRELARPIRDRHPLRAFRRSFAHRYGHLSQGVRRAYPPLQARSTAGV